MYTTPQLCSLCRGITVQSLVPHRNAHGEVVNPSGYPHQPSYNALVESAQKCHLCEFFRSRIENTTIGKSSNQGSEENGDGGYYLLGSAKSIVGPDSPKGITTVGLRSSNVSTSITVSIPFGIAVHPGRFGFDCVHLTACLG